MFAYGFDQSRFQGGHKLTATNLGNLCKTRKTFYETKMNFA